MRLEGVVLASAICSFVSPPTGTAPHSRLGLGGRQCIFPDGRNAATTLLAAEAQTSGLAGGSGIVRAGRARAQLERLRIAIMEDVVKRVSDPKMVYHRKDATVGGLEEELRRMRERAESWGEDLEAGARDATEINVSAGAGYEKKEDRGAVALQEAEMRVEEALRMLRAAKVVAVIRGGHPQRVIQRAKDLASLPLCGAIEIALDSPGALGVLQVCALEPSPPPPLPSTLPNGSLQRYHPAAALCSRTRADHHAPTRIDRRPRASS